MTALGWIFAVLFFILLAGVYISAAIGARDGCPFCLGFTFQPFERFRHSSAKRALRRIEREAAKLRWPEKRP